MKLSARNCLNGVVNQIVRGPVSTEVTISLGSGGSLAAVITSGSAERLDLQVGASVLAIVKASSIIIGTDLHDATVSARNILCGTVVGLNQGVVSTEVAIAVGGDNILHAVITHESALQLGLTVGGHACALFKASSIIIGVE